MPLEEYEATLDALVRQANPGLQGLVLLTPYLQGLGFDWNRTVP